MDRASCPRRGATLSLLIQKLLPRAKQIVGGDAKAFLDEETKGGLPGGSQVEKRSAAEAVEIPQQLFQTVGDPCAFAPDSGARVPTHSGGLARPLFGRDLSAEPAAVATERETSREGPLPGPMPNLLRRLMG